MYIHLYVHVCTFRVTHTNMERNKQIVVYDEVLGVRLEVATYD